MFFTEGMTIKKPDIQYKPSETLLYFIADDISFMEYFPKLRRKSIQRQSHHRIKISINFLNECGADILYTIAPRFVPENNKIYAFSHLLVR